MGNENSEGKRYTPGQIMETTQTLLLLQNQMMSAPPRFLRVRDLKSWHQQLATPLGVKVGEWRTTPMTFGSFEGTAAPEIQGKIRKAYRRANIALYEIQSESLSSQLRLKRVIEISAYVHARLIRMQPFEDGNGRAARLVLSGMFVAEGFDPPDLTKLERTPYLTALNRYNNLGQDRIDCPALQLLRALLTRLLWTECLLHWYKLPRALQGSWSRNWACSL